MSKSLLIGLGILAAVLAAAPPSHARGHGGHGFSGGHGGHRGGHSGGHFHHRGHGAVIIGGPTFFVGPAYPYWWDYPPPYWYSPPVIVQQQPVYIQKPSYWYYCQSARAYYPMVPTCPEPWVRVPAAAPWRAETG